VKARNELIEIQSRLEALQKLQSKLNHMDGQVAALTPEQASRDNAEEPEVAILPASDLPAARYVNDEQDDQEVHEQTVAISAKDRVLQRKEAERLEKQRQYEADLSNARIENAGHNDLAQQRKKQQYGGVAGPPGAAGEQAVAEAKQLEDEYRAQLLESTARIDQLKTEHGGYDDSDISEEEGLSSDSEELSLSDGDEVGCESSGNLDARSQVLHKRCVEALGAKFEAVYHYLRQAQENNEEMTDEIEDAMERDLTNMVGGQMMGYVKLVEQLIFIEECLH